MGLERRQQNSAKQTDATSSSGGVVSAVTLFDGVLIKIGEGLAITARVDGAAWVESAASRIRSLLHSGFSMRPAFGISDD